MKHNDYISIFHHRTPDLNKREQWAIQCRITINVRSLILLGYGIKSFDSMDRGLYFIGYNMGDQSVEST